MLSFVKENGDEKDLQQDQSADHNDQQTQQGDQQDFLAPAANNKTVKQTTVMLMILFTIGAVCLWFMIKKTTPATAEAATNTEEVQIEIAIAQLTGIKTEMADSMGQIVEKFHQFSEVNQVAVSELKKNPFKLEMGFGMTQKAAADKSEFDASRRMRLKEEVEEKAKQLKLWSIMASEKGGCCMINENILYKGDSVDDFTVTAVKERQVELESEGIVVILRMPE